MPRSKPRKTSIASWNAETMEAALKAVADGKPIRSVSRGFKIPFSSIRDRIRMGKCYGPLIGRKTVFTEEQEQEFAEHIISLGDIFFEVSCNEIRRLAFEYAQQNDIANNFSKKENRAGKDWLAGFLKRHPRVIPRKPDFRSPNKLVGMKRCHVSQFFSSLEDVLTKHNFNEKRIYCMDEIDGNYLFPSKASTNKEYTKDSSCGGEQHNLCCCANADGDYLVPLFSNERLSPNVFLTWLQQFVQHTRCSDENPVLLILDNDTHHISLASYQFCKDNGICLVSIPPRTSHKLQPLCVVFFKQLKVAFTEELEVFLSKSQKVTSYDLMDLFKDSFAKVTTVENIVIGFQKTGIWPLNPNIFTDDEFRRCEEEEEAAEHVPCMHAETLLMTENEMNIDDTLQEVEFIHDTQDVLLISEPVSDQITIT